ncbi:MAG: glycosyltransferase [Chloroflexi bacterium]|nr:glycosyltransferase [Chloroflexota bacterium]
MTRVWRLLGSLLWVAQAVLASRVIGRLLRTRGGSPIRRACCGAVPPGRTAVLLPVLDEAARLAPCLDGLTAQSADVGEILVIDAGSRDHTAALVQATAARDRRLRLIEAGPAPAGWNGKVWGLHVGRQVVTGDPEWLLTVDADVRAAPGLARSLVVHAERHSLRMLSVATRQRLSGPGDGLIHPALLATLVYRFGMPGAARSGVAAAVANGQCCLVRRDLLDELGGFAAVRDSLCEDVTLARLAARAGDRVGFSEAAQLVEVQMYAGWREAWRDWPRSLTTRDRLFGLAGWIGLLEVLLVQALPVPLLLAWRSHRVARSLNACLVLLRVGILIGMARAYRERPATYWLSPLLDPAAALALWLSAVRRHHQWRGRSYARQSGRILA